MDRIIVITDDQLLDVIDGEIEEMPGDSIVRKRVGRLLARDCARRKFVSLLLPALDAAARRRVMALVAEWEDPEVRAAGAEVLAAAWDVVPATCDNNRPHTLTTAR